jgi:very-short-patch-repair endonuclease
MPHTGLKGVRYNAAIGRYKVDAHIPGHNLAIEIDGFSPHYTPATFAADRERENDLKINHRTELLHFAYRTLRDAPERVVADIARATSPGTTRA